MTQTKETLNAWIDACYEYFSRLTKWEQDFLDSIDQQFSDAGKLSDKQIEILERIYAEKTK